MVATPALGHPAGFVNVKMTSCVLPIGDVAHSVAINATNVARCIQSMAPSSFGSCFARKILTKAPKTRKASASRVGSHWLLAALLVG